jgi:hypothetical protein
VHSVASTSMTYTADMMCGVPANSFGFLDPGHLHTAVIPSSHVGHGKRLYYRWVTDRTQHSSIHQAPHRTHTWGLSHTSSCSFICVTVYRQPLTPDTAH